MVATAAVPHLFLRARVAAYLKARDFPTLARCCFTHIEKSTASNLSFVDLELKLVMPCVVAHRLAQAVSWFMCCSFQKEFAVLAIDELTPAHSRRDALSLAGASLAAAPVLLVGGCAANTQTGAAPSGMPGMPSASATASGTAPAAPASQPTRPAQALQDARKAYAVPPFPAQQNPWPGLTSRMNPRPDHGEKSYVGSGRLAGRKALITGGDSGIGHATALAFAREGADICINYLPDEESDAQEVAKQVRAAGRKIVLIPGDIQSESFCRQLVSQAARDLGGLDILVNNAAKQQAQKTILDITTEQFDQTMKTNLYAMFWITKAAVPLMQPGACIINTSSVVAYDPPASLLDYSATKSAMVAFTKSLAKQLIKKGIRVNAVAPGPYWTPLQPSGGQPAEKILTFGLDTPMGRPGQPGEISPIFVLLASNESSYTTGAVFGSTGAAGGP